MQFSIAFLLLYFPFVCFANEENKQLNSFCLSCHSSLQTAYIPPIYGQPKEYLQRTLRNYRSKLTPSTMMQRIADRLTDDQINNASKYFSSFEVNIVEKPQKNINPGKEIYQNRCSRCHDSTNLKIPYIKGLPTSYLSDVIIDFTNNIRLMPASMGASLSTLNDDEMKQLIEYLGSYKIKLK